MIPSLYRVVNNIKNTRSGRTTLMAGCMMTLVAMLVIPSVVQAYGEQMADNGYYGPNSSYDLYSGYGGDYPAYSDGGYGGYPAGYYQGQAGSNPPITSATYGLNTPYYYNGMWNSEPTPSPLPTDTQVNDNLPVTDQLPVDSPPLDGDSSGMLPEPGQVSEPSPAVAPPSKTQPVAIARATAKVVIEKTGPSPTIGSIPAMLPATGSETNALASGVAIASVTAAAAYYANSRRELGRVLSKR